MLPWAPHLVGDMACVPRSLLAVVAVASQQVLWAVVTMGNHGDVALVGGHGGHRRCVVVGEEDCLAVHDAKPNVSVCRRSFGKVAARTRYINQWLYAPQ